MMGLAGEMIGWLGYHLGLRTDGSDPSGSLHAKAVDLKNYVSTVNSTISHAPFAGTKQVAIAEGSCQAAYTSTNYFVNIPGPVTILGGYLVLMFVGRNLNIQVKMDNYTSSINGYNCQQGYYSSYENNYWLNQLGLMDPVDYSTWYNNGNLGTSGKLKVPGYAVIRLPQQVPISTSFQISTGGSTENNQVYARWGVFYIPK